MSSRGLLREAFMHAESQSSRHGALGADFSRRSPKVRSGKEGLHMCSATLPIAAEIQAILKGGGGGPLAAEPDFKSCIFGCSPPPRDCTNALVRDTSFSSMRAARPAGTSAGGSCSTAFFQSERPGSFGALSCMSPPASALSTA